MRLTRPEPPAAFALRRRNQRRLVLGLGNDLLSDDAIGLRIVAAIQPRLAHFEGLVCRQAAEMGLSLLDWVVDFDELLLIDAIQTGRASPGYLHCAEGEEIEALPTRSPHAFGVNETLALGRTLGLAVPTRVRFLAVEVADPFTVSTELTPALARALPELVDAVVEFVTRTQPVWNPPNSASFAAFAPWREAALNLSD